MNVKQSELDHYEDAIEKLLIELQGYEAATTTLRRGVSYLAQIREVNADVGRSVVSLSDSAGQILERIKDLELDQLIAETTKRYVLHQTALEQLSTNVHEAVREQQRLGLEMLQHTAASQKELASFSHHVEQAAVTSQVREDSIDARLQTIVSETDTRFTHLETQIKTLKNLLIVSLVLLVLVVTVAFLR